MPKPKKKPDDKTTETEETDDKEAKKSEAQATAKVSGEVLSIATSALESLTSAVERLSEADGEEASELVASIAEELYTVASDLAQAAGIASADEGEASEKDAGLAKTISDVREFLGKVSALLAKAAEDTTEKPTPQTDDKADALSEQLANVNGSINKLTDTVKQQNQRLATLEKGIALPNSRLANERNNSADEDDSWPLDFNRPRDRASIDKATSFHDD